MSTRCRRREGFDLGVRRHLLIYPMLNSHDRTAIMTYCHKQTSLEAASRSSADVILFSHELFVGHFMLSYDCLARRKLTSDLGTHSLCNVCQSWRARRRVVSVAVNDRVKPVAQPLALLLRIIHGLLHEDDKQRGPYALSRPG